MSAHATTYLVTTLRTGFTEDGLLEIQLLYGPNGRRGASVWFQLNKAQQTKLDRDLWSRRDAERARSEPQRQQQREKVDIGWNYWDTGE